MRNITAIPDTSCLIILSKLDSLELLKKLYGKITITPEIASEFAGHLPEWIEVVSIKNKNYQKILETMLDIGESSALALAYDSEDALLILDDLKARKEAVKLGFKFTGTLGVLYKSKQEGFIKELKPCLEDMKAAGFRISKDVENEVLFRCDEM